LARVDLADIARVENDTPRRVALWKELVYETERKGEAARHCVEASRDLAAHSFQSGSFAEGVKSLATTYNAQQLPAQVMQLVSNPLSQLTSQSDTAPKGNKLADDAIAWLREQMPADLKDDAHKAAARQSWFYIADVHMAARRPEKVPEVYDQMQKLFGTDDAILGRLAAWFKSQNRRDEARATYNRFANQADGQSQIAFMYREEKKYDQAVAIYQNLVGADKERAVQWQSTIATTYREAGKPDQAVAVYQQLLTDDAKNANQWQWQIAVTYRDFGKLKEAIASFRLCDNFPEAYQQMAWCHRGLKEYKEAILLYNQILASHPATASWALLQIGYTQEQSGDKESAIKTLQQVCKRFPKTGQASEAHAHLQDKYKITATLGGATADQ
jgi:tetratricopeptide (TPR) repeat protein